MQKQKARIVVLSILLGSLGVLAFRLQATTGSPLIIKDHKDSVKQKITTTASPHPALSNDVYLMALNGYQKIISSKLLSKQILAIVDFSKPSTEKRLFIIDLKNNKVLINTHVAHGQHSGENNATRFSNTHQSHQSSLGFYVTGKTYYGSNGYSLKLKGLEPGFNDQAESRAIVMHGAPYVSESAIKNLGRLGRSWGCPAVSVKEHQEIIELIKDGSCLFVYAPENKYLTASTFIHKEDVSYN